MRDVESLDAENPRSAPREMIDNRAAHPADSDHDRVVCHTPSPSEGSVTLITILASAVFISQQRTCGPRLLDRLGSSAVNIMRIGALLGVVAVLAAGGAALIPRVAAAGPIACESLVRVPLSNATVLSAETIPAGGFTPPGAANASAAAAFKTLPAFCRVTARLTPTPDSDIRVEVWLPLMGWNRKLQAVGNGGLGGTMPYPSLAAALRAGYARSVRTPATSAATPISSRGIPKNSWTLPIAPFTR